ncbi:MmcQ/YjbR family DNA-binding protein [Terrabacter sp. NPDC000476]|uniref:MmcQ/YjbR family DNA-binding protein n=1 Tax=Terrabacter sp. NPDC000476 TaxID=3154258 RepID=UPI00331A5064
MPVTIEDVRRVAQPLPRSTEVLVRDRVKFRVGKVVWLAFSADETQLGFAFPREERDVLVASEPAVFLLPRPSDLRFNWVDARLDALEPERMREIVVDAWRFVVPRSVALAPGIS